MAFLFFDARGQSLPFRLRGIGVEHRQEAIRRSHGYPYHQWIQVRSGRLRCETGGFLSSAGPGDGIYLAPGEFHAYGAEGKREALVDWACFDGSGVEAAMSGGPLSRSGVYRLANPALVRKAFTDLWTVAAEVGVTAPRLSVRVYAILMALAEAAAWPGRVSAASGARRLEPVLAAIGKRPASSWDMDYLASIIGVTPQHLGRLFRQSLGQPPLEYLIRLRLNRALKLLLERPDLRVHEIGEAVGYGDSAYFIRLFKSREGTTPGQFRSLHGADAQVR
jgi:AraC family transcriptional regulator of arabinose operon